MAEFEVGASANIMWTLEESNFAGFDITSTTANVEVASGFSFLADSVSFDLLSIGKSVGFNQDFELINQPLEFAFLEFDGGIPKTDLSLRDLASGSASLTVGAPLPYIGGFKLKVGVDLDEAMKNYDAIRSESSANIMSDPIQKGGCD